MSALELQQVLSKSPFLVPLQCKSVFKRGEARLSVAPLNEKQNACFQPDGGFELDLPYPFMFGPVPSPWFGWNLGHGQIVSSGVHTGIATSSPQIYCKLLEGIHLVNTYNKLFAQHIPATTTYIEQAGEVKKMLLKLLQFQENREIYSELQRSGVNWATLQFQYYLMAGLDEAFSIAFYNSSIDTSPVTQVNLEQIVAPLIYYRKAREAWSAVIPNPEFGKAAKVRAFHACLAFCVQNKRCPWHPRRVLSKDGETGKVMQVCLREVMQEDSQKRLEKQVNAFLKGCTLPAVSAVAVDVEFELIQWLEKNEAFCSKSRHLMSK